VLDNCEDGSKAAAAVVSAVQSRGAICDAAEFLHDGRECCWRIDFGPNATSQRSARNLAEYGGGIWHASCKQTSFRYSEAVMEADIELATVIFALSFAMPCIVQDLSVIAGLIDRFKFARGPLVLLGSSTLYPPHARGLPLWCAIFAVPLEQALDGLLLPLFANSNDRVTPATMRSE